ncbi:hypothetical protein RB653_002142 [Dictyostelium firmibasis]|uniref:Amino acid transporter transmembrane domain-containing protein n=1 Tax=Dictyostelium firmibasis TaxID=79012 RepID=A0AAN7TNC5_9MYCE
MNNLNTNGNFELISFPNSTKTPGTIVSTIDTVNTSSSSISSTEEILESQNPQKDEGFNKNFGLKSIGTIGGICLLIGNCTGPGMVNISYQFQQGGWFLSLLGYILMLGLSGVSALFIIESMSMIPGNNKFGLRVEFTMICRFYFGKWMYIVSQIFINTSLIITNIASIIICSQVFDSLMVFIFKKTCGISFSNGWLCVIENSSDGGSPFQNDYMFITIGYLAILVLVVPLGFFNLNDNIIIQIACVIIMLIIVVSWVVIFVMIGLSTDNLPTIGNMNGISQIIGNCMFNYAFITTIPSWVNESKPTVNLKKSVWISTGFSTILFIIVGIFGALSFSSMSSNSTILSLINLSNKANIFSKLSVYLFPFIVLASTIPVFSIIVRYNLTQNKFLPTWIANIISIVLPWLIVIPFQTGDWLNIISNYSSLFFGSVANFIIPFILYIKSLQFKKKLNYYNQQILEQHQQIIQQTNQDQNIKQQQQQQQQSEKQQEEVENPEESVTNGITCEFYTVEQEKILKELSLETRDTEENTNITTNHFKSLSFIPRRYSKVIAQFCLITLSILIVLVIFSNFYFTD